MTHQLKFIRKILTYFPAATAFLFAASLSAQSNPGFERDYIFIEASYAGFSRASGGIDFYRSDILNFRDLQLLQSARLEERREHARYRLFLRPTPEIRGQNARLALEYAMSDVVSVGYALESSSFHISNVPFHSTFGFSRWYLLYMAGRLSPGGKSTLLEKLAMLTQDEQFGPIPTLNGFLGFHFNPRSYFDPYLRLGIGLGPYEGYVARFTGTLGFRVFLGKQFYLTAEGYAGKLRIYYKSSGGGGGSSSSSSDSGGEQSGYAAGFADPGEMFPAGLQEDFFTAKIQIVHEQGLRFGLGYKY